MEKYLSKKIIVLSIFVIFIFLISFKLFDGGIISYTDSSYHFPNSNSDLFSTWSDNYLGVSRAAGMSGSYFYYLSTFLEKMGFDSSSSSYIINFFPVLILCLIVYSVAQRISGSVLYGYFAGSFIILNNFMLEQFIVWPGIFFFNVISLVILFYLTYEIHNSKLDQKKLIYLIINSLLISHPFFFVMYIIYWGIFSIFYYISRRSILDIYKFIIATIGIICVNLYWLFPFLSNLFVQSSQNFYNGNLMGLFSGYTKMASYVSLFNFYNYPGFLSSRLHSGILQYVFYFGLLIIFIIPFVINKKYKNYIRKDYAFLIFLFFIFILFFNLALGPKSKISGKEWMWAFSNIPGFGFFRSFTRFLVIPLIAMIISFGLSLKIINIPDSKKNITIILGIIFLILSNLVFFSGNLNGALGTIKVPKEYYYINDNYFRNNEESFNIISLPNFPYEAYRWTINSKTETFHQMTYFDINFFSKPIAYGDMGMRLENRQALYGNIFNLDNKFEPDIFNRSIAKLNVKYIIVKKDLVYTSNIEQNVNYEEYYKLFKFNRQYVLKEDNEYFALFENKKYLPTFVGNGVSVNKIFPTNYAVSINNLIKKEKFEFAKSYDQSWGLYINKYAQNKSVISAIDLSYLYKKPIFDDTHKIVNQYANQWTIDPEYIKQSFSKDYYKENPDGSIDVEMVLYFKPQSYFYLGGIISITTLIGCLGYLVYDVIKRRKKTSGQAAVII